jgi:hypothetical protein
MEQHQSSTREVAGLFARTEYAPYLICPRLLRSCCHSSPSHALPLTAGARAMYMYKCICHGRPTRAHSLPALALQLDDLLIPLGIAALGVAPLAPELEPGVLILHQIVVPRPDHDETVVHLRWTSRGAL